MSFELVLPATTKTNDMKSNFKSCPECGQNNLYSAVTSSGPVLLPKLGSFIIHPEFQVVVCVDCGHTRFFASEKARKKIPTTSVWKKL